MANPLDSFSGKRGSVDVKIRTMPRLSDYFQRYGSTDWTHRFDAAMENWRQDLQRIFPSDETITNTITTIIQTVNTATGGSGGSSATPVVPAFDPTALIAQIAALSDALADHIAQVIVHGTSSPVVGETDEQSLERKTIGESFPRNARFKHALQVNEIESGEVFTVPAGFNLTVTGPFTITGTLIIEVGGQVGVL